MISTISIAELLRRGVTLRADEAVAIVQKLIHDRRAAAPVPPFGPPTLENVYVSVDGSVLCRSYEVTPAVSEIGILLQAMLPVGTPRVPGGLRYAVARALLDVDAPPFDSIEDLSSALGRFETSDRTVAVRRLIARAAAEEVTPIGPTERRRSMPSATDLRRALRELDAELYERTVEARTPPAPPRSSRKIGAIAAGLAAGIALIASGEAMHYVRARQASRGVVAPPVATRLVAPLRATEIPLMAVPPPSPDDATLHAPRRAPVSSARRAIKSARAEAPASEDHIGSPQPGTLVAALDVHRRPVFSPAFASNGSAVFSRSGRTDAPGSVIPAGGRGDDLRVMTIVDDGARNYHVQPSPDGGQIAFDSDRDGDRGVYVANRDGSGVRRVSGDGYAAVPTWSPDGRRLAFVRAETDNPAVWNLWLLSLDSGNTKRLTSYPAGQTWSASWFRDGRRVAYTHEDQLVILDLDTGATRAFASPIKGRQVRTPAVSPDGEHVIFQVYRSGGWVVDLSDGSMRCVLTDPTVEEFAWSPDGRRVAYHSRRDGNWGIFFMAAGRT